MYVGDRDRPFYSTQFRSYGEDFNIQADGYVLEYSNIFIAELMALDDMLYNVREDYKGYISKQGDFLRYVHMMWNAPGKYDDLKFQS